MYTYVSDISYKIYGNDTSLVNISIPLDFIVHLSNQNALFIQRKTESYFPRSNLFYILQQIIKQNLGNKSIADFFCIKSYETVFSGLQDTVNSKHHPTHSNITL